MDITEVRIRKNENGGRKVALASVTFDNEFVVHNISIINGKDGLFISMPSQKNNYGQYKDIAHPINSNFRDNIQNAVLEAYNNM